MEIRVECADCQKRLVITENRSPFRQEILIAVEPCNCNKGESTQDCSDCEDMELLKKLQGDVKLQKEQITILERKIQEQQLWINDAKRYLREE